MSDDSSQRRDSMTPQAAPNRESGREAIRALVEAFGNELVLDLYDITDAEERASVLALGAPFE